MKIDSIECYYGKSNFLVIDIMTQFYEWKLILCV
jgi:hypothetical protein